MSATRVKKIDTPESPQSVGWVAPQRIRLATPEQPFRLEVGSVLTDVTVEYCLMDGINDAPGQAEAVARLLSPLRCKVNLIPLNPVENFAGRPPPAARIRAFAQTLLNRGVPCTVRAEKGADIGAACGQLAGRRGAEN